jgi:hypothetical protein
LGAMGKVRCAVECILHSQRRTCEWMRSDASVPPSWPSAPRVLSYSLQPRLLLASVASQASRRRTTEHPYEPEPENACRCTASAASPPTTSSPTPTISTRIPRLASLPRSLLCFPLLVHNPCPPLAFTTPAHLPLPLTPCPTTSSSPHSHPPTCPACRPSYPSSPTTPSPSL